MNKISKLKEAVEIAGGRSALAAGLGVSPQLVWNWMNRDLSVPAQHCPAIERLTAGKVVCEDFWPGADWAFIRNTARQIRSLPADHQAPAPDIAAELPTGDAPEHGHK